MISSKKAILYVIPIVFLGGFTVYNTNAHSQNHHHDAWVFSWLYKYFDMFHVQHMYLSQSLSFFLSVYCHFINIQLFYLTFHVSIGLFQPFLFGSYSNFVEPKKTWNLFKISPFF